MDVNLFVLDSLDAEARANLLVRSEEDIGRSLRESSQSSPASANAGTKHLPSTHASSMVPRLPTSASPPKNSSTPSSSFQTR